MSKFRVYLYFLLHAYIVVVPGLVQAAPEIQTGSVLLQGHYMVYDYVGEGRTVVLIHGLFGSKNQWRAFANNLQNRGCHVFMPDLPGYGKSIGFPSSVYDLSNQVILLHQFIVRLHLHQIELAGSSMGGLIAAMYAAQYPDDINSIAFIGAPFGIVPPKLSQADLLINQGKLPFVPTTVSQFKTEMSLLFKNPPNFSNPEIKKRLEPYQREYSKDLSIWHMLLKYRSALTDLKLINMPILIVWGDEDKILDVSGSVLLKKQFSASQLVIVPLGSHLLFMEMPEKIAQIYVNFLTHVKNKGWNNAS